MFDIVVIKVIELTARIGIVSTAPSNETAVVEIGLGRFAGRHACINEAASLGSPVELPTVGPVITVANGGLSISGVSTGVFKAPEIFGEPGALSVGNMAETLAG